MNTFQTLLALVVLIFVLSVIVQAVQEVLKSFLNTKAATMEKTIERFMGTHLTLPQVENALQTRGLDITALEHFNKEDFRHLLDGIDFTNQPLQGIVADATATLEQKKDNIAAAYEAARTSFQKSYTTKNKQWVVGLSFTVVLILNANLIMLYQELAADQVMAQAIVGKADKATCSQGKKDKTQQSQQQPQQEQQPEQAQTAQQPQYLLRTQQDQPAKQSPQNQKTEEDQQDQATELASIYKANRDCIKTTLKDFPILVRSSTKQYGMDWQDSKVNTILACLIHER